MIVAPLFGAQQAQASPHMIVPLIVIFGAR